MPLALQGGQVLSGFMQVVAQFHTLRLCGMAPQKLLPAQGRGITTQNLQFRPIKFCSILQLPFPFLSPKI